MVLIMNKPKVRPVDSRRNYIRKMIMSALKSNKYSMRSLAGIAKEINISEDELKKIISSDSVLSSEIKTMPFRSKEGKVLVMSKERFIKEAPFKVKFMDFFASKRQGVKDE